LAGELEEEITASSWNSASIRGLYAPTLYLAKPPTKLVTSVIYPAVMRPKRESEHSYDAM